MRQTTGTLQIYRIYEREIMDIKLVLFALAVLIEAWLGDCCDKCIVNGSGTCHMRRRRSLGLKNLTKLEILKRTGTHFSITLDENPCVFETYDLDNDGIISKEELEDKLSDKKETRDLFAVIDTMNGDGEISFSEFCAAIPTIIDECEGCCYV